MNQSPTAAISLVAMAFLAFLAESHAAADPVSLTTNPPRVCADSHGNRYLNFDLVVHNPTTAPLKIGQIKARSFDAGGQLIEQRILWQDALSLLGEQGTIAPGKDGLVFNPFTFDHPSAAAHMAYEVTFEGQPAPSVINVQPQSCVQRAHLRPPLHGRLLIHDGYDFLSHHRRQTYQARDDIKAFGVVDNTFRFALDFIPVDERGSLFKGRGEKIEDWYGWGMPVLAAGEGVVTAVRDDMPDNALGSEDYPKKRLSEDEMNADGNYVLIDHGNGEISAVSHLRRGSAQVRKGQHVRAGDVIASVGNSGATPVPHVHYELRSGWGVRGVRSSPAYFEGVQLLGSASRENPVALNTGDVVIAP